MDPDATLAALIDAAVEGERFKMFQAEEDLFRWLSGGGQPPKDPRQAARRDGYHLGWFEGDAGLPYSAPGD